jgi:hypothetical protein
MTTDSKPKSQRRRQYIVDRTFQLGVTYTVLGVIATVGFLYLAGLWILPDAESLRGAAPTTIRTLLVGTHAGYLILTLGSLAVISIILTHRIAGPAMVLRKAVRSLQAGVFDPRLTLRKRDYLHDLAADLSALASHLRERDARMIAAIADVQGHLDRSELDLAIDALARCKAAAESGAPAAFDEELARV